MKEITKEMAYKMNIVSWKEDSEGIKFYCGDIENVDKKYLDLMYRKSIILINAKREDVKEILDRVYSSSLEQYSKQLFTEKQLDELIDMAIELEVSDIHMEPQKKYVTVRFRKDGTLFVYKKLQFKEYESIIIRMKLLAKMDIADKLRAQDGKLDFLSRNDNQEYDIRISTVPSINGEKAVMRILYKNEELINLKKLNFTEKQLEDIDKLIKLKHGIVLVNGPTGSGKSTTLYSILKAVNKDQINISTIEDPVEFCIEGITQININEKVGLDFSSGLKHLLRQDPDVVMIGEIRDEDTAKIAVRSAITGHRVFSTIHTNTPQEVFYRLLDMGVEKYLLLQAINGIISQRLIRKLCIHCKESYEENSSHLKDLGFNDITTVYRARGCKKCNFTGYDGRTMVSEVLVVGEELRKNLRENKLLPPIKDEDILTNCRMLVQTGVISMEEFLSLREGEGY